MSSSDGLDPSGPAQPNLNDAYTTSGNPVDKEPTEQKQSLFNKPNAEGVTDKRIPQEQSSSINNATPSSLGYGIHGAPPGEEARGRTPDDVGRHRELDAEQMAAPGEGKVAKAVEGKPGASGSQPDLAADLDRKKGEQREAREGIRAQRSGQVDVGGVLGQTGGPANPVDKDGYPNKGSE